MYTTLNVQFYSEAVIPVNSILQVIVPKQATVALGTLTCAVAGWISEDGLSCSGDGNQTLYFPLPFVVQQMDQYQFIFKLAFNTPASSDPTDSFQIFIWDQKNKTILAQSNQIIQLTTLQPSTLVKASILQVQSSMVGQPTTVIFQVFNRNPIPIGGGIQIALPKWNNLAQVTLRNSYIIQNSSAPLCQAVSGMSPNLTCSLQISSTTDYLVVQNAFPVKIGPGLLQFNVSFLLNPLSMSPVGFTVTTFSSILSQAGGVISFRGLIDQGTAYFTATQPAQIDPSSCQIGADNTVVYESTQILIPFKNPVPIQQGCQILITLPTDFIVDASLISISKGWGIFGGVTDLGAQVNGQQNTINIINKCQQYSQTNVQSTIRIGNLTNPPIVRTTRTFTIQIFDQNSNPIAQVTSNVFYTPTSGQISMVNLSPLITTDFVSQYTPVQLFFQPQHNIYPTAQIYITMPVDLPIPSCLITAVTGDAIQIPSQSNCIQSNGVVIIQSLFKQQYIGNSQQLSITFNNLKLPDSQRMISGIVIQSYDKSQTDGDPTLYLVDQISNLSYQFFSPIAMNFFQSSVKAPGAPTYSSYPFQFSLSLASQVPIGSIIQVVIPSQILVIDRATVTKNCMWQNSFTSLNCTIVQQSDNTNLLTIYNGITTNLTSKTLVSFSIAQGLLTPISTETTDTFQIYLNDKNGYLINYVNSSLGLTIQNGISISTFTVVPESMVVGDTCSHNLTFITPVPILPGFILEIFIPTDIVLPLNNIINCNGIYPLLRILQCQLNGNRVTVQLKTNAQIQALQSISINIGPLINPGSFQPTIAYALSIRSSNYYDVADFIANVEDVGGPGSVTMTKPAQIKTYSFSVFDQRQYANTTVTISWVSTQIYPSSTIVKINYNSNQFQPQIDKLSLVPCIFGQSLFLTCDCTIPNQIIITNTIPSQEIAGQQMQLTITNMKINVGVPLTTDSWVLTTYKGIHVIDQISSGLSIKFDCNYPCQTCDPRNPNICTSCDNVLVEQILYQGKCYVTCPTGTFLQYFQCQPCDSKCLTCEYTSGTSCTSCNPQSQYPFLNGKDCTKTCGYGFFGNSTAAQCQNCSYPCQTCSQTTNQCTSCSLDRQESYYLDNQCQQNCPPGYYVDLQARNNICLKCSSNCQTCFQTAKNCMSCPPNLILNLIDNTCVSQCPNGITIYNPNNNLRSNQSTCEPCQASCKTCAGNVTTCTSCGNPLNLFKNQCILQCGFPNQTAVSIKNTCVDCISSCLRCQNTPDYCIKCKDGFYFFNNKCVENCPMIGDYQFYPNKNNICEINIDICQFGYKPISYNDGLNYTCVLINQQCQDDFELNADKTACIPASHHFVPFPMVILMVLLMIPVIVSKKKFQVTLIVPTMTIFVSFVETICIIVLVAESNAYGITPTFYLSVVGFIFLFASNMFFMLMYVQQVKTDSAFKHWYPKYERITNIIQALGVFNFKMFRLLYCRMFGRNEFNAPFTESNLFYRPLNLTSLFVLITVSLPLIVSSIIGLIYVSWGYQLYITCIEMLIIQTTLIILQIVEYCAQNFQQKKYFKVSKKNVEIKVKSEFPDSDDGDEYGKNFKNRVQSKPKSIKAVRNLGKIVARMAGNENFAIDSVKQVEKEIEELHQEDIMSRQLRHCQSFKTFRPTIDEAFSGEESEEKFQDFISEPASPRSKEMLFNRKFIGRMHYLHDVYKMRDQFDNCYHQPVDYLPNQIQNPVDKNIQTNVLEMLGIDDALIIRKEKIQFQETEVKQQKEEEEKSEYDEFIDGNGKMNRRKRLSKKRIMEIPDFEYDDITGEFEADENGKFLLVQKQGRLHDKRGRLVNRRGYLIDQIGNVINKRGKLIFNVDELSPEDDELPDPFCYEKIRQLKSNQHEVQFRIALHSQIVENKAKLIEQQQQIELEYQENKEKKLSEHIASKINSEIEAESSSLQESIPRGVQETSVQEEEELFIQKLTQMKQPKSKNQLLQAQARKAQSQRSQNKQINRQDIKDNQSQPIFKAMRPPSQTSVHRVEQLQEIIQMKDLVFRGQAEQNQFKRQTQNKNGVNKYVPGQEISQAYLQNETKLQNQRVKVALDQEFLHRMENFNKQLVSKRKEFLNNSQGGKYLNSDAQNSQSSEFRGLAHRNLNNVYGRVKQKFNQNVGNVFEQQQRDFFAGPSATINKKIDNRMQELEEIYMHPRVDGKEQKIVGQAGRNSLNAVIESLDVTKQLRNIHHLKSVEKSVLQSQYSGAGEVKSQQVGRQKEQF